MTQRLKPLECHLEPISRFHLWLNSCSCSTPEGNFSRNFHMDFSEAWYHEKRSAAYCQVHFGGKFCNDPSLSTRGALIHLNLLQPDTAFRGDLKGAHGGGLVSAECLRGSMRGVVKR